MTKKRCGIILIVVLLLAAMTSTAIGEGYWYYGTGRSGVNVYVKAYFVASQPVTTTSYGLKLNKHVKQVQVKLVEGDYSETKKSSAAASKTDGNQYQVSIYHFNNPLVTSTASKTWYYF